MIRYRVNIENPRVVIPVECDKVGYPERDADGFEQLGNTHYDTRELAIQAALNEAGAALSQATRTLAQARGAIRKAESECAVAAVLMTRVLAIQNGDRHTLKALEDL